MVGLTGLLSTVDLPDLVVLFIEVHLSDFLLVLLKLLLLFVTLRFEHVLLLLLLVVLQLLFQFRQVVLFFLLLLKLSDRWWILMLKHLVIIGTLGIGLLLPRMWQYVDQRSLDRVACTGWIDFLVSDLDVACGQFLIQLVRLQFLLDVLNLRIVYCGWHLGLRMRRLLPRLLYFVYMLVVPLDEVGMLHGLQVKLIQGIFGIDRLPHVGRRHALVTKLEGRILVEHAGHLVGDCQVVFVAHVGGGRSE